MTNNLKFKHGIDPDDILLYEREIKILRRTPAGKSLLINETKGCSFITLTEIGDIQNKQEFLRKFKI